MYMAQFIRKQKNPFLRKNTIPLLVLLFALPVTLYMLQQTISFFQQAEEVAHIQIQPDGTALRSGQSSTLNIVAVSEKQLIQAVSLTLSYPQEKFTVQGVDTDQSAFQMEKLPEQYTGTISLSGRSNEPLIGNNLVAQVTVTALDLADTQEVASLENAQITVNENGEELIISVPVKTVYGQDGKEFKQRPSLFAAMFSSLIKTFQKIIP